MEELNTTTATAVAGASAEVPLTALNEIQTFTGNEFAGEVVVVEVTSPSHDEWGTEYWGAGQWGVGDGVTIALGQETVFQLRC
jgi:nitrous oxidase accessory protein NosD